MQAVRFGGIDFINSYPLIRVDCGEEEEEVNLILAPPSELYKRLLRHDLDVAMIPSYSLLSGPLSLISGHYVIAGDGPVRTVNLYCKKPLDHGVRIGLDMKSRTSVKLLQLLMKISGYKRIHYQTLSYDDMIHCDDIDAFLLIGDDNFKTELQSISHKVDLGQWWKDMKGIPFIYAVTAAYEPDNLYTVHAWLEKKYDCWRNNMNRWLMDWSNAKGIPENILREYLTKNIYHKMNPGQIESGVRAFQELCVRCELLKEVKPFIVQP